MESISSYVQTTPYSVRLGVIWLIQEICTTGWLEIPLETVYERLKINEDFLLQRFYFKLSYLMGTYALLIFLFSLYVTDSFM